MKCQILCFGKKVINLSSAEFSHRVVKLNKPGNKISVLQVCFILEFYMLLGFKHIQLNFNGLNIFGTTEICSRHEQCEPLLVNHSARSGGKW